MHRPTIPVAPLQVTFPFSKTGGMSSPLQIAETAISSSLQLAISSSTSNALKLELPASPGGPGGPASPRSTCSPCGPCSPRSPLGPGGPGNPEGPRSPATPRGPAGPGLRSQPIKSSRTDAVRAIAMIRMWFPAMLVRECIAGRLRQFGEKRAGHGCSRATATTGPKASPRSPRRQSITSINCSRLSVVVCRLAARPG